VSAAPPRLSVRDLSVDFVGDESVGGAVRAVDAVSFDVGAGEIVGVAGESGSGKSTLAQAILRTLPPPGVVRGGQVLLDGVDLLGLGAASLRAVRWKELSWVMQSALDALNPVLTVRAQLDDVLARAEGPSSSSPAARDARAMALMADVGLPPERLDSHPHQLSGGMRQRVAIALALALEPALLVLDEPTTALDVVVERDLLRQLLSLQRARGFSVLFIGHDLGRIAQLADRIVVLYAGRVAEIAPGRAFRARARHPYARQLLAAMPGVGVEAATLRSIPGAPPSLRAPPAGCRFHPRCARASDACVTTAPPLVSLSGGLALSCHHPHDVHGR